MCVSSFVCASSQYYFKLSLMANLRLRTDLVEDLECWMTKLPERLRNVPVIHLAIPGSHDSMTYGMTDNSHISPDVRPPIQYFKFLGPLIQPTLHRWSKTQAVNVSQQLTAGIRYFDLRIAYKSHNQRYFFVHNLYCSLVEPILRDIRSFLDSHPKEIVILDCQHFYNMTALQHNLFTYYLKEQFHLKLLPYTEDLSTVTLDHMSEQRRQIILIYRWDLSNEKLFWPAAAYPTPWPNTVSPDSAVDFLDKGLETRDSKIGFVSQCLLTPTIKYALSNCNGDLRTCCCLSWESIKDDWIKKQKPGEGGVNVIISDFIEYQNFEFCEMVINLNDQLLDDERVPNTCEL